MKANLSRISWVCSACLLTSVSTTFAQQAQLSATGSTGGLVIPTAHVLEPGTVGLSYGNYSEPLYTPKQIRKNYSLGVGLGGGLEVFGRLADYENPPQFGNFIDNGIRDLSANAKWQLPFGGTGDGLRVAIGLKDISGGASRYGNLYAVATDRWGPAHLTLGLAKARAAKDSEAALRGVFGGAQVQLVEGVSALAEYAGKRQHVGLRYASPAIQSLGGTELQATLMHSSGGNNSLGQPYSQSSLMLSAVMPFEQTGLRHSLDSLPEKMQLPEIGKEPSAGRDQLPERSDALRRALLNMGFERIRIGIKETEAAPHPVAGAAPLQPSKAWVIEYENHRYNRSEFDALGIIAGLAAELAPSNIGLLSLVTLKTGQAVYTMNIEVAQYRRFLRDLSPESIDSAIVWQVAGSSKGSANQAPIQWAHATPSAHTPVRIRLRPELIQTIGTDVGILDYSIGMNVQAIAPVWEGGNLLASYIQELSSSENFKPNRVFESGKIASGVNALALQQSVWLGSLAHVNVGVGKFLYKRRGMQIDSSVFVPGLDGVVRLRAGLYNKDANPFSQSAVQLSGSYRMSLSANSSLEAGWSRYRDGGMGPTLVWSKYYGDYGVHLNYKRSGSSQYAGLDFSVPLTRRQGDKPGLIALEGTQSQHGARTRILNATNNVSFLTGKELRLEFDSQLSNFNNGKISQLDVSNNLTRMREAFFMFARQELAY